MEEKEKKLARGKGVEEIGNEKSITSEAHPTVQQKGKLQKRCKKKKKKKKIHFTDDSPLGCYSNSPILCPSFACLPY
ncbi:hypothetical protein POVWA2_051360 [Plasmodium ovale wallikeri]|uniref:Uncharacterized protein n=1 Tax=Plasmodium ovale wallikeri TaxID=864142 RepID=A0A1A8ZQK4_PLAOA|nr:hypothetical protein POVWA1_013830 [Plasmodium ovale wallikeri]SBT46155.1 hypothetical protein POVWA2_051360 [Plasmodium ovale wallikeri]